MYNVSRSSVYKNWNKKCYIATKKIEEITYDDYGNEINIYNKPEQYMFNIQPAGGYSDIMIYGENVTKMYKAVIPMQYCGKFKEGDIAYLNGAKPDEETKDTYGSKGNYVIDSVREQNVMIAIYFKKIQK